MRTPVRSAASRTLGSSRRSSAPGDGTEAQQPWTHALGPLRSVGPCRAPLCSIPKPDARARRGKIVGSHSAMRDQAVVRCTCSIGFLAYVRIVPKGGELQFATTVYRLDTIKRDDIEVATDHIEPLYGQSSNYHIYIALNQSTLITTKITRIRYN